MGVMGLLCILSSGGDSSMNERCDRHMDEQGLTSKLADDEHKCSLKTAIDICPVLFGDLSLQSKILWAKLSDEPGNVSWLPLVVHMSDSCGIS